MRILFFLMDYGWFMSDQLLIMDAEFYGFVFNFRLYKHLEVHMGMSENGVYPQL